MFIGQSLAQAQLRLAATLDGLSDAESRWRPGPEANSIGFMLWHVSRVEDGLSSGESAQVSLWESAWHARCGHPVETPAVLRDRESALDLEIPDLALLRAYQQEAAERAGEFAGGLQDTDLDRPSTSWQGMRLADVLRHLATHKNNHHGQIDFLRGLQQDAWDLPPGTGVQLPD